VSAPLPVHAFTRRVAFGLPAGVEPPQDPVAWAVGQLQRTPPIDIIERDRTRRADLPAGLQLLWSMDEVMHASHTHQEAERASFEKGRTLTREQFQLERRRDIEIPYFQLEHWKETQARASTALHGEAPVFERFWHFWTNHFMVAPGNQNNDTTVGPFQRSLREKMLGSFRDLLWHATVHPAMLVYLDNNANTGPRSRAVRERWTRNSINENLGRELLELFTLSPEGGYTQKDVEATTLILTGWRDMKPDRHRKPGVPLGTFFDFDHHEPGAQTVMGKTYSAFLRQSGKLEDLVTDLAAHPATARHLARKLCVYFLDDEPPAQAVAHVERVFIQSKGHLPAVHQAVIEMAWAHIGTTRKFVSPETWLLQTLTLSGLDLPRMLPLDNQSGIKTHHLLGDLGQPIPRCPQPNGWPIRSVEWISKELLDRRVRYAGLLAGELIKQDNAAATLRSLVERHVPAGSPEGALVRGALARDNLRVAHTLLHVSPSLLWA
jgi:uncharacterized protein (DUF1800 family)